MNSLHIQFHGNFIPLFDYFCNNFILIDVHECFPPEIPNPHSFIGKHIPKTNNSIEGWHNAFFVVPGQQNTIWIFYLEKIRKNKFSITNYTNYIVNVYIKKKKYVVRTRFNDFFNNDMKKYVKEIICRFSKFNILLNFLVWLF